MTPGHPWGGEHLSFEEGMVGEEGTDFPEFSLTWDPTHCQG